MALPDPIAPPSLSAARALWLTSLAMGLGLLTTVVAGAIWSVAAGVSLAHGIQRAQANVALTTFAQLLGMGSVILLARRDTPGLPWRAPRAAGGPRGAWGSQLTLLFLAGCALQWPLAELSNLLQAYVWGPTPLSEQQVLAEILTPESTLQRAVVLVCIGLLVPVLEEGLFRGVVLGGLVNGHGRAESVLISAALFGLSHLRPVPVSYAFVAGLLLGAVAWTTRSVAGSAALHAGVNCVPVLLSARELPIAGFNVPSTTVTHLPPALPLGGLVLGAVLLTLGIRAGRGS